MRVVVAFALVIPLGLDLYLPVPEANPITPEKTAAGRALFRDTRLSRDGTVSCASCHDPARGFSSERPVAIGVFGRAGRRNAPALINRGYGRSFFWDGRVATLEEQVLQPIEDPNEMDLPVAEAASRVGLTPDGLSRALATYVRTILAGDAPYDRFVNGDRSALGDEPLRGLQIFRGKGNCTACHVGPNFSDEQFHNTGIAWKDGSFADEGRFAVSGKATDRGAFKTPTLREAAHTAPYMHDGSVATLSDVIDYYDRGANANPYLDPELRPLRLTPDEKRSLIAFLQSLSGHVVEP